MKKFIFLSMLMIQSIGFCGKNIGNITISARIKVNIVQPAVLELTNDNFIERTYDKNLKLNVIESNFNGETVISYLMF